MKRLLALWIIGGTIALNGCGGSSKTPPPPTGGFSVASLKGQYGFSRSVLGAGRELCC
jgi:hypothetical protein